MIPMALAIMPSVETMDNVASFARLAAAAIENVYIGSVEPHREVAERVARILDLTAAASLIAVPGRRRTTLDIAREIERRGFPAIFAPSRFAHL